MGLEPLENGASETACPVRKEDEDDCFFVVASFASYARQNITNRKKIAMYYTLVHGIVQCRLVYLCPRTPLRGALLLSSSGAAQLMGLVDMDVLDDDRCYRAD